MSLHRRPRVRPGYTLIELLIALALGASVLLVTAQVFQTALRGRERLQGRAGDVARLRRAYDIISRDMHSAVLPQDDTEFQLGLSAASAGQTGFQMATAVGDPLMAGRPANETVIVRYSVTEDPDTGQPSLFRHETPYQPANGTGPMGGGPAPAAGAPDAEMRSMILLPGVASVSYMFYDPDTRQWANTWGGQTPGLPSAIRMDLVMAVPVSASAEAPAAPRAEQWIFSLPAAPFQNEELVTPRESSP